MAAPQPSASEVQSALSASLFADISERVPIVAKGLSLSPSELISAHLPHLGSRDSFAVPPGDFAHVPREWRQHIAVLIDHTQLKPAAQRETIATLCEEAKTHGFASVCVNSSRVQQAVDAGVPTVCTVVGFPLGAALPAAKAAEADEALKRGAKEVDMVLNRALLKDGEYEAVLDDVRTVQETVAKHSGALLKVILETNDLSREEIIDACIICVVAGAAYVKTSTGFNFGGAKEEDVFLMKSVVGDKALVKASGGVRTYQDAVTMVSVGASRIGASAGVAIVTGQQAATDGY